MLLLVTILAANTARNARAASLSGVLNPSHRCPSLCLQGCFVPDGSAQRARRGARTARGKQRALWPRGSSVIVNQS